MNLDRSVQQQELFDRYAKFAREQLNTDVVRRCRDGIFDRQLWNLCASQGVQGLCIPVEYGGVGLSATDTIVALEALGYGCEDGGLAFALGAQLMSCSVPLWLHGSEDQKRELLPGLSSGKLIATNAITEEQGGSAAFQMQSFATLQSNVYTLAGSKSYCANAPVADLCLAYITTDRKKGFIGGTSIFILRREEHAYVVEGGIDKLGLKSCQTGRVVLDGVTATPMDLLGRPGVAGMVFSQSMDWERTGLAALHVGTMTRLLERAVEFAKSRKPGGVPITKYQAVSHVLVDISVQLEAACLMVNRAARVLAAKGSANREAASAKLFASELFKAMTVKLMQIHAQQGYTADSDIGRALQDAIASTVYSGTSEVQRNIIARWLGC